MNTLFTYDNIVEKILELFPELKNSGKYYNESDRELRYLVLGNLSLMAFENINEKNDFRIAERLLVLSNEIFNEYSPDKNLIELFCVGVLESLTESKNGAILAKRFLNGKSLQYLEETLKDYSTEAFLEEFRK